jgi:hypothetical protein
LTERCAYGFGTGLSLKALAVFQVFILAKLRILKLLDKACIPKLKFWEMPLKKN